MKILLIGTMLIGLPLCSHAVGKDAAKIGASSTIPIAMEHAPATLESLLAPHSGGGKTAGNLRSQMLTEAGKAVGFRGGMASRSRQLRDSLLARAGSLDKMYQFSALVNANGTIPPVIVQAQDVAAFAPDQVRTASRVYKIERGERFVSVPPSWRDYLFVGLPNSASVDLPVQEARPQDAAESAIWRTAVKAGWDEGNSQADAILDANFSRLTRDYTGMLLYSSLLRQKMISATRVAELAQSVSGDGTQIMIGDTLRRLTGRAQFDVDYSHWQPAITYLPDASAAGDAPPTHSKR